MTYRKKLIEVALPLDEINYHAAREKSIRHGHPSTLHLWWARRPLAACRAVLFASLVDDPSSRPDEFPTEADQERERKRLFEIIEKLVKWENVNNERVLDEARAEIFKSTDGNPPPVLDPFCGGGSIPLEAQRLGLKAYASDLNPVAVLITKAMIEIPSRFAGQPPVNPDAQDALTQGQTWKGAAGLAKDVHYYGKWMRNKAKKRIGHFYPKVKLPKEHGGAKATVIAWIWARTVKCPNPACGAIMPLVRSFWLSKKKEKKTWIEPIVDRVNKRVRFEVKRGDGIPPEGTVDRRGARCIVCGEVAPLDHVRAEGRAGRMEAQMMATVAEGNQERIYLAPSDEHVAIVDKAVPHGVPETGLPEKALGFRVQLYGMTQHQDLFTQRQLTALTVFSDLVSEARERVEAEAIKTGCREAGTYADAVATYLGLSVSRSASMWSSLCWWQSSGGIVAQVFTRQALAMIWDYAEVYPFSNATGNWSNAVDWITRVLELLPTSPPIAKVEQNDAALSVESGKDMMLLVSTDPPYYDNIGYADLSDFFYIWLRRSLKQTHPELFKLMLVPKSEELIATPYRFGGDKVKAEEHFLTGLDKAFHLMRCRAHPDYPMTVYYGFKQTESDKDNEGIASTGWEKMLEGLLKAGFQITGTWPMRTERPTGVKVKVNALASSIVLVCRPRSDDASMATRRDFIYALRRKLPDALRHLQEGNIAPVDLAQAAIGPGIAVFSQYSRVLEADGNPMRVRTALQIINAELDAHFAEQEGDLDPDTRFCIAWFEQYGMEAAAFGEAHDLARAKNTSVEGVAESGVLHASAGKVRLLNRDEYPDDWDATSDSHLNTWKCAQYLIRTLDQDGEGEAARLVNLLGGGPSEAARALAYRLYAICDRKGWTQEALPYNLLVTSWTHIQTAIQSSALRETQQEIYFEKS